MAHNQSFLKKSKLLSLTSLVLFLMLASCTKFQSAAPRGIEELSSSGGEEPLSFDRSSLPVYVSTSFTLNGLCISGSAVLLEIQDSVELSPSCTDGHFATDIPLGGVDGPKVIKVSQTDSNGRLWQDSVTVVKDSTPPMLAIINVVRSQSGVVINGTCESGMPIGFAGDIVSATNLLCTSGTFQVSAVLSPGDGSKNLSILQVDQASNRAQADRVFGVDTSAPNVTVTAPANNAQFEDSFSARGTCESGIDVVMSGTGLASSVAGPCSNSQFNINANLSAGLGNKAISFTQTDASGNVGRINLNLMRIAATGNAPVISISAPAVNTVAKAGLTVIGTCTSGLNVVVSGAVSVGTTVSCANGSFSAPITFSNGEGNKTVTLTQTNAQGQSSSSSRNFIKDSVNPVISIINPVANAFVGNTVTVNGACETGITVVLYGTGTTGNSSANCVNALYSGVVTLTVGDGSKEVRTGQTDSAQNSGVAVVTVRRDSVAPIITISSPAAGTLATNGLTITGSCENGLPVVASGAGVSSTVQANCASQKFSLAVVFSSGDGTKAITLTQTDGAGNKGTVSRNFTKGAPPAINGSLLYAQNCAQCHDPLANSTKLDRTAAQIDAARLAVPAMKGTPSVFALTSAEIQAIAQVLKTTTTDPGMNPFLCQAGAQPQAERLQRLAKSEYVNSLQSLFSGVVSLNELSEELALVPEEVNQANPFDRGADSMSLGLVQGQNKVSIRIASLVTSNTTKMNAIFSESCFTANPVTDTCLTTFIDRFGAKVYRRPVKTTERAPLIAAYKIGSTRAESSAMILRALLMSPNFLYHLEYDGTPVDTQVTALKLSSYELASRLSYMITNSPPDATLLAAAANNSLQTASVYDQQMNRLLALPAAKTSFRRFFSLWLELHRIPDATYSTAFRAGIDASRINADALEETLLFTDHVVFENKKLSALLTDRTAFIKSPVLAQVYGISLPTTADGRTQLPAGERAGVLTRVAANLGGHDTTSPIHRGVAVRRSLLCDSLSAPDPATLPPGSLNPPPDDPLLSTRKRFENKTSPAACTSCHSLINPIGYALENFDSFGRYRTVEKIFNSNGTLVAQHPIDAMATINLSAPPDPDVNGGVELSAALAESQKLNACFSKKWFQFTMRRNSAASDNCVLASTYDVLKDPNKTFLDAIKSMITNAEFKQRRVK